jgi:hypothetical protein
MDIWSHPDNPDLLYIFFDKFPVNEKVYGLAFTRDHKVHITIERAVNLEWLTVGVETEYVLKTCLALARKNSLLDDGTIAKYSEYLSKILKHEYYALLLALQKQILYEYNSWDGWDVSVYMLKHYLCIARSHGLMLPLVELKLEQVLETESQRRLKEHSAKTIQRAWFKVWLNPYHPMGEKRMHLMISELESSPSMTAVPPRS